MSKTSRKDLPQLMSQDVEDKEEIVLKLEKMRSLKQQVGVEPNESKNIEGSGLLKELYDIKQDLAAELSLSGLEGFRHNNLAFVSTHMPGRETLNTVVVMQQLVKAGVAPDVVKECFEAGRETGKGFYKHELVDLAKPRKNGKDKGEEWK